LRRLGFPGYRSEREIFCTTLRRALAADEVDCVMVNYLTTAVEYLSVWSTLCKPVMVHCHGYDVTPDVRRCTEDGCEAVHASDYQHKVRSMPQNVSYIANSRATLEKLKSFGVPEQAIDLAPLGVPVPDRPPRKQNPEELVVLYLGRLVDFKGPHLTILAFEEACRLGLKGRLVVAGAGPLMTTCQLLVARSDFRDRIELVGPVSAGEGAALRQKADVFTAHNCTGELSLQEEALGVSFLEAMAAALPVVTGWSGGVAETVVHGRTGLLFTPGSVTEHALCLLSLQQDEEQRMRMGEAGWSRVHTHFSESGHLERLRTLARGRIDRFSPRRSSVDFGLGEDF